MHFGAAYYPEHRDPSKWEADLDTMVGADVTSLRVAEFAWSRFEPEPDRFDFSWMERFLDLAHQRKISLLMCPPIRTLPAWLMERDPNLSILDEDGIRLEYGSRYTFCINHPLLRERGAKFAEAMTKRFDQHPGVVGWHLDNEHGDEPDCHCAICKAKFQEWCEDRYGSIEALNEAWGLAFWGLHFNHFAQVPTPRRTKAPANPAHLLAWRRFRSACTIEVIALQSKTIRPHLSKESWVTTNHQPNWNQRTDYFDAGEHLDISGTNYYPPYGDDARAISMGLTCARGYKGQNFQVHELRNSAHMIPGLGGNTPEPGEVEKLTLHYIGNGADGIFYFRWDACPFGTEQHHGTILDFDGRPRRIYPEVQKVGRALKRIPLEGTTIESEIAMLYDFPTRWVMQTGIHWNGPAELFLEHHKAVHAGVRAAGVNLDVTSRHRDWSRYKVLIVPFLAGTEDALADKLSNFVEEGGQLVLHPFCGIKNDETRLHPRRMHSKLIELCGAEPGEYTTTDDHLPFTWNRKTYSAHAFADLHQIDGAEVLARYDSDWWAQQPALLRHGKGEGSCWKLGTLPHSEFYTDLTQHLIKEGCLSSILPFPTPASVEVCERRGPEGQHYVFLLNHSQNTIDLPWEGPWCDVYHEREGEGSWNLETRGSAILQL